jgi:NADH-quinone oxidoreductase subunit H
LFFLGEYIGMFAISGLGITLFLGGWHAPLPFLNVLPSWLWFFAKLLALICVFIWVRGTLPRLRLDQLMNFAWKFMLPLALMNIVAAGMWRFLGPGWERWLICALWISGGYIFFARALAGDTKIGRRTYRYVE